MRAVIDEPIPAVYSLRILVEIHKFGQGAGRTMAKLARSLTDSEAMVLGLVQEYYGPWNTTEEVFLSDRAEAIIFVKDVSGDSPICVNLTVCASAYGEGSVSL